MVSPLLRHLVVVGSLTLAGASVSTPASAQYYYPPNPYVVAELQRQEMQRQLWLRQQAEVQRQLAIAQELQRQRWIAQQLANQAAAQAPTTAEVNRERGALTRAQLLIARFGMAPLNARVQAVIGKLESFSGESFRVLPTQSFNWGQAHANGIILFDLSSAVQTEPVLAFRLAHEWGHEVHGDQPNLYNPFGSVFRVRSSPTEAEDRADEYAGEFLCTYHYDIDAVKEELVRHPTLTGDSHSGGEERARSVQRGCDGVLGRSMQDVSPSDDSKAGDVSPDAPETSDAE